MLLHVRYIELPFAIRIVIQAYFGSLLYSDDEKSFWFMLTLIVYLVILSVISWAMLIAQFAQSTVDRDNEVEELRLIEFASLVVDFR